ncbi:MAG: hypothetical protein HY308_06755 [Gammaproteobacteria bacterium]|nr:hypothetical protein [Gammaproteobacteria bacterium]
MPDIRQELNPTLVVELHARALELADTARAVINQALRTGFDVKHKADGSYVTSADIAVEEQLRALIGRQYPDHGIIGEEFAPTRPESPFQWILDPIDGTEDFVHHLPTFGSILALYYGGRALVGVLDHPVLNLRCHAAFGRGTWHNGKRVQLADLAADISNERLRLVLSARANFMRYRDEGARFDTLARTFTNHRIYRSCYGHSLAAIGAVDAMVDYHDTLWDIAAAPILIEEAGGEYRTVRDFVTADGTRIYSAVFGRPRAVERLSALLVE